MKLKKAILSSLNREGLSIIIDNLEIDDVDKRSVDEMQKALSRSRTATPEILLEYLYEAQVKEICELCGVSSKGRRRELIQRLLEGEQKNRSTPQKKIAPANTNFPEEPEKKVKSIKSKEMTVVGNNHVNDSTKPVRLPDPPPGMHRITKTELVWPGKYKEDGTLKEVPRVNLPFQVIETINEGRATREAKKGGQQIGLFDVWEGKEGDTFEDGWKNKLIWGDNLLVMGSLLEKFAGKIDLIYIDPPFATGADFSFATQVGDYAFNLEKTASIIEEKAYRDTWGRGLNSYLEMISLRLQIMQELLAESGVLYLHIGPDLSHLVRAVCDEIFGPDAFLNEIVWKRTPFAGSSKARASKFPVNHDTIFFYVKRKDQYNFEHIYEDYSEEYKARFKYKDGRGWYRKTLLKTYSKVTEDRLKEEDRWIDPSRPGAYPSYKQYLHESKGKQVEDIWGAQIDEQNDGHGNVWEDLNLTNPMAHERTGYSTQKPEVLLERILKASTKPGDLVADFFCGSGTTMAVAEKIGRRWIGCDLSRWAINITRKRLLGIENCRPFEVLNLGKYERKYWMGVTFGGKKKEDQQVVIFQYIVFMLKLYNAEPLSGMQHIHGKRGKALVHVGAVDAPVTIDEVNTCIEECLAVGQTELHVLGWEWEMGMTPFIVQEAKRRGVKLLLLTIPREVMEQQAVDKGDIRFFEVAHLEIEIKKHKTKQISVTLTDFAFPYADMIPEDVRDKIKKWSDYIDYWAIDWNFQNDTFMNGWVAYRTRRERKLPLTSDIHTYEEAGKYTIMAKVVDIFGNDTSQTFDVEVK